MGGLDRRAGHADKNSVQQTGGPEASGRREDEQTDWCWCTCMWRTAGATGQVGGRQGPPEGKQLDGLVSQRGGVLMGRLAGGQASR